MADSTPRVAFVDPNPDLRSALDGVQRAILRHPVAAQAAFSALVAEGRAYASTDEGQVWLERLQGSELVERLRMVWEAGSLGLLERDTDVLLPGALIEALAALAARGDLEAMLSDWFAGGPAVGER